MASRPLAVLAFLALSGVALAAETPAPAPDISGSSVGVARMLPDRTIMVGVRGPDSDTRAQAVLIVEPGDFFYQRLIDHLGGLKPGESKLIPPWPDAPPAPPPQEPPPNPADK